MWKPCNDICNNNSSNNAQHKVDSEDFLGEQIGIKLHEDAERPVIVSADDNVEVGSVVSVLDIAKQKGADKVSLVKGGKGSWN